MVDYAEQGMLCNVRTSIWSDGTKTDERRRVQENAQLALKALFFYRKETEMHRLFDTKSIEGQNQESQLYGGQSLNEYSALLCGNAFDCKEKWEYKIHHFDGAFKEFIFATTKTAAAAVTISCHEAYLHLLMRHSCLFCALLCENRK
jgi:hypothetical protein